MSVAERIGTRADQGFPPKIEDDETLEKAAALLADPLANLQAAKKAGGAP